MLTLYHSPHSRSTRIVALIAALDALDKVDIKPVHIKRNDGSGHADPANPHPDGKVPLLVTEDGEEIRESNAIMLYLTDHFAAGGPGVGQKGRGTYLGWLAWYGNVFEPVHVLTFAQAEHPIFTATWRGVTEAVAALETALSDGRPYLMGDSITAADMIIVSTYFWFPDGVPDVPVIRDWVARCADHPAFKTANAYDLDALVTLGLAEPA
ncbi:glutathione S-transferase family protein [Celeribacter arenosi]|uniref:Glutathione S-transferase family protein n=1 Tax=Celeribacter arenosi TaxID=792649 RepID=A0ABP7KEE2_9RHOB